MFETLLNRVARTAERRARTRTTELTGQLERELPSGIDATSTCGGARLAGRGLKRCFWINPVMRWMIIGLVK